MMFQSAEEFRFLMWIEDTEPHFEAMATGLVAHMLRLHQELDELAIPPPRLRVLGLGLVELTFDDRVAATMFKLRFADWLGSGRESAGMAEVPQGVIHCQPKRGLRRLLARTLVLVFQRMRSRPA
jgi:hypothetical protein